MSVASVGSYSAQTISLYTLLTADVVINATVDATGEVYTRFMTILVLVAQLVVRIASIFTIVGLLASSGSSQDEFLLRYCGVFTVSLFGLILCLFLRVFRVTLASFPSAFPTVLDYWGSTEYCLLLLSHALLSLLFYYCVCRARLWCVGVRRAPVLRIVRQICPRVDPRNGVRCANRRCHHGRALDGLSATTRSTARFAALRRAAEHLRGHARGRRVYSCRMRQAMNGIGARHASITRRASLCVCRSPMPLHFVGCRSLVSRVVPLCSREG